MPAGTTTALPVFPNQGKDEPQFLQNVVAKYLGSSGSNLPIYSSPDNHLKCSGKTNIFEANALPENFLHREQWQYWNIENPQLKLND